VVLHEGRVRERVPLVRMRCGDDDPLPEGLTATGRIEEVCARECERVLVRARFGELERHVAAGEARDHSPGALEAGHAEDPRGADLGMPGRQRVDDLVVASASVGHGSDVEDVVAFEEGVVRLDALRAKALELAAVLDEAARRMEVEETRRLRTDVPEGVDDIRGARARTRPALR